MTLDVELELKTTLEVPPELGVDGRVVERSHRVMSSKRRDKHGSASDVWFWGRNVIKAPSNFGVRHGYNSEIVLREAIILSEASKAGISVPQFRGVYIDERVVRSFILMQKLNLRRGCEYVPKTAYDRELAKIDRMGFRINDFSRCLNCGVGYDGNVYFYDCEQWDLTPVAVRKMSSRVRELYESLGAKTLHFNNWS